MRRHGRALLAARIGGSAPRLVLQALFPQMLLAMGVGGEGAGTLMMTHSVSAIAAILLFDRLWHRLTLRNSLLVGGVLSAGGLAAVAVGSYGVAVAVFSVVGGFGWGLFGLKAPQEFVNVLPSEQWRHNMKAVARGPIVAALGIPPCVLLALNILDWRVIVAVAALLVAVSGGYAFLLLEQAETPPPLPAYGERLDAGRWLPTAAGLALSGYIAGMFNAHFILLASDHGDRGPNALAAWSLLLGLSTIGAVNVWSGGAVRQTLSRNLNLAIAAALVATIVIALAPAAAVSLLLSSLWPVVGVGLFIEAMRRISDRGGANKSRLTSYSLILHMLAGSAGAYVTGTLAAETLDYGPAFKFLGLFATLILALRIFWARKQRVEVG